MTDEAVALRLHHRVRHGVRRPANWLQLVRFGLAGASGYAVNLGVFTLAVHGLGLGYRMAAVLAFLVAVSNNFALNRRWTFRVRHGRRRFQAARFLVVSVATFLVTLGILTLLVEAAGLAEVLAQAIAIACGLPLSFLGQKLWSFAR